MSDEPEAQTEREQRLNGVMAAFLGAVDVGETPDRAAILAEHPDLADELRAFFADHDRLDQLARPLREIALGGDDAAATLGAPAPGLHATTLGEADRYAGATATMTVAEGQAASGRTLSYEEGPAIAPGPGTRIRYIGDYEP
jgi:hypothetical protein